MKIDKEEALLVGVMLTSAVAIVMGFVTLNKLSKQKKEIAKLVY